MIIKFQVYEATANTLTMVGALQDDFEGAVGIMVGTTKAVVAAQLEAIENESGGPPPRYLTILPIPTDLENLSGQ